jgi:mannose-6-phosphate isomerase
MSLIDKTQLYPLKFAPIYKDKMWGGNQMEPLLNRKLPKLADPIGEAWEIVDRPDEQSIVSEGELAGMTLEELVENYGSALVGSLFQGGRFPLLVKIIDAGKRLSLQVHPDRSVCAEIGEGAEPKTEMWYIMGALPNAQIMAGLKSKTTRQQVMDNLTSADIEKCLQIFPSIPGDAYFISSGTIHAIGAGNLLLEIQQSSDTTYRVSDWGRVDSNGIPRELHVEKAIKSIHFTDRTSPRISGVYGVADRNRKYPVINHCPFFIVDDLRVVDELPETTAPGKSFHMLTAINHPIKVGSSLFNTILQPGETGLIPACFGQYKITPIVAGESTVIRTVLQ